ncbi:hypothetical protein PARHAE_00430 [Paracoccus haematequi]|uniref:PD(D/E)XK endonuclease domain-containing protein n=1 Tax=Paracoccus haematequi TaxID=2491866 RepID=A0A3S4EQ12_9RHOB|nr:hypothetical protein [Paracoccus haematequi]VDS07255.1 hypothetical protein PARHAE_00430 [Paracoccus haematequi]
MTFTPINPVALNARQKELRNFHKIAARLADYGFHSMWLSDDWQGADFLAVHIDGKTVLRVQLKSRLAIDKKYLGKDLHIAFRQGERVFVYPHDEFVTWVIDRKHVGEATAAWSEKGFWHWSSLPVWASAFLEPAFELRPISS